MVACGGGGSTPVVPPVNPPPTATIPCGTAAATNPPGGGGTAASIVIDPAAYGTADATGFTVYAFSQNNTGDAADPEVLDLVPDLVPRAWGKWDRGGTQPQDYNFAYSTAAKNAGIAFIGGTTASALYRDEFTTDADFLNVTSCDASGNPVLHDFGGTKFYRATLASTAYRQYLINIGKIQIDGGVTGLFFDEVDGSYAGATYNGNEGFDNADVADFGGFLCAKYPALTAADWTTRFDVTAADKLDCTLAASVRGRGFDYRGYLKRHGWQTNPLAAANPLAAEWGNPIAGHADPSAGSFVQVYPSLVYWQDVVVQLRNYARQKYNREIYITANGIFPFADFQSVGLWDYNPDGPGGTSADYAPVTNDGHLNATVTWLSVFRGMKQRSQKVAGRTVPVSTFEDWPTGNMSRYYAMPQQDRQDFVRLFTAESYAAGVYFALPLKTSMPADPTASRLGMMPLFQQLRDFYKAHANLYRGASDVGGTVTVSAANVVENLTQVSDGSTVLHLVNHNYSGGFQTQTNVAVSFPMAAAPANVTLVSPDLAADTPVAFVYSGGNVQVTIPQLVSYVAVVAK